MNVVKEAICQVQIPYSNVLPNLPLDQTITQSYLHQYVKSSNEFVISRMTTIQRGGNTNT